MAFLNDLSKKITQTSQEVVKKTKDSSEIYRQENLIAEEKRKIDSVCLQLGKMYYELHADNYEESFDGLVTQIKECENRIAQCMEQIDRVKGVKKCPQCGSEIPFAAKFCNSCGYLIENTETNDNISFGAVKCSNCGSEISEGSAFCENCGTPVLVATESTAGTVEEESQIKRCENCGEEVGGAAFCPNCGTKID